MSADRLSLSFLFEAKYKKKLKYFLKLLFVKLTRFLIVKVGLSQSLWKKLVEGGQENWELVAFKASDMFIGGKTSIRYL